MNQQFRVMLKGAQQSTPLIVAAMPFGIIYGALAQSAGLSEWAIIAMSVFVFAGSSQFIAIGLLAAGASVPVIILTTFFVNIRHMLYAANLLPFVKKYSQRVRLPMAFLLTDETFAVSSHYLRKHPKTEYFSWFYFGSALFMYGNWIFCSLIGLYLSQTVPNMSEWGLDVAMAVAFIGIVAPSLHNKPTVMCALIAAILSVLTYHWPNKVGLLVSSICAIAIALYLEKQASATLVKEQAHE
ncbi:branched-chain amino acid permease [Thalassotalea loyana]|uniref:Branched-chain amino acid permease n=1 Tax=Thalassotalea loyana TaxID=280483 RepID=A0ABQ6H9J7_9GAMM|nr:AzlC family ABC transporter permease [Thalassotalea loyana]GLX83945.1 branched-chain amino acid permease [Thalassotalea loyana]